jgi:hypothetical protein
LVLLGTTAVLLGSCGEEADVLRLVRHDNIHQRPTGLVRDCMNDTQQCRECHTAVTQERAACEWNDATL